MGEAFSTGYQLPGTKPNPGEAKQRKARASFLLLGGYGDKVGERSLFLHCINSEEGYARHGRHGRDEGHSDDNSAWTKVPVLAVPLLPMHPFPA